MDCVNIEKPKSPLGFAAKLAKASALSGRSPLQLLWEITALRLGAGRLSFEDYWNLRLYDNALYKGVDKKTFAGAKMTQKICLKANYRCDYFGLVNNKIAADILLSVYGFPIMPTTALFQENVGLPGPFLLRSEEELRAFLTHGGHYPLFGKPLSGHQSIGTVSVESYDARNRRMISTMGHGIPLDTFVAYVKAHAASGYLLQKRVLPHEEVRKLCGNRLATLRLLTIMSRGEPTLLRGCWKIPAGLNAADNFWRPGNLLAEIDLESGQVLRAMHGTQSGFDDITHHPDSGAAIVGSVVPHWQEAKTLALKGAKAFADIPLIGWDIAPVDGGVVIVEVNEIPDFKLHQLADRRGIMDAGFMDFMAERKAHAAHWVRETRKKEVLITELVPRQASV